MMKAAVYKKYGTPDVINVINVEQPTPNEDEVLIKVNATTVTPSDYFYVTADIFAIRLDNGLFKPKNTMAGCEFTGTITSIGKNVTNFKVGEEIIATGNGTHCEYVCLNHNRILYPKSKQLSSNEAACFCYAGLTALPFLRDVANLKQGQKILIIGASGAIGLIAIQLAKDIGAKVTAVCSTKNHDLVSGLGADTVIDYNYTDYAKQEIEYDVIFDVVFKSSFTACKNIMTKSGIYMNTKPTIAVLYHTLMTKYFGSKRAVFFPAAMRKPAVKVSDLAYLTKLFEQGKIKIIVDRTYPLKDIKSAFEYVGKGHKVGNVVINMP